MRKKHSTSLFAHIAGPMILVAVLQVVVLLLFMYFNGLFANFSEASENLLLQRTQNRQMILSNSMTNQWSNLESTQSNLNTIIGGVLCEEGKNWTDIKTDSELNHKITEACLNELIYRLRSNKTTGIFMILDGANIKDSDGTERAGVYFRHTDPSSDAADNRDIELVRGIPKISQTLGVQLDSFWAASFDFTGDEEAPGNRPFYRPFNEAIRSSVTTAKSKYAGYWSGVSRVDKSDYEFITYSIPLINSDGFVYGVLGVEVSCSYLEDVMAANLPAGSDNFYYLGITEDGGKTYKKVVSAGNKYKVYFDLKAESLTAESDSDGDELHFVSTRGNEENIRGMAVNIELYNPNTAFLNEQWALIGMQDYSSLYSTLSTFRNLFITSMLCMLAFAIILSFAISSELVRPISKLAKSLADDRQGIQKLPDKTGIKETDVLTSSIKNMAMDIERSAKRTSRLIEVSGLPVGVYEIRDDPAFAYCSEGFYKVLGIECKEGADQISVDELKKILEDVRKYRASEDTFRIVVNGDVRFVRIASQDDPNGLTGSVLDVTEEVNSRRKIEYERDFDSLTDIWNRRAFEQEMKILFEEKKDSIKIAALIMMDLDNLKYLNDTYGHDCGDQYIREFASRLSWFCGPNSFIARRSGDEFYVFIYGYENGDDIRDIINRGWDVIQHSSMKLENGNLFRIRVSGGISWYPFDAADFSQMVYHADFAMYQVKRQQKGNIKDFNPLDYEKNAYLFNGRDALDRLIDNKLVHFVFQPIISAYTGEVFGYEALMRSDVPELKSPELILRLAKVQGKLHHIEYITWMKSLQKTEELMNKGVMKRSERVFLNSIANQLLDDDEFAFIEREYGDILGNVVMEVTESENNEADFTQKKLSFVIGHSGMIAIDDFGTGYNSDVSLISIPADIVKIDISFVRNVDKDESKRSIITNLIRFAKQQRIEVLAEGVETKEEMETVIALGVDYIQGFYIARPEENPAPIDPGYKEEILESQRLRTGVSMKQTRIECKSKQDKTSETVHITGNQI